MIVAYCVEGGCADLLVRFEHGNGLRQSHCLLVRRCLAVLLFKRHGLNVLVVSLGGCLATLHCSLALIWRDHYSFPIVPFFHFVF